MSIFNYIFRGGLISVLVSIGVYSFNFITGDIHKSKSNCELNNENADNSDKHIEQINIKNNIHKIVIIIPREDEFDTGYGYYVDFQ